MKVIKIIFDMFAYMSLGFVLWSCWKHREQFKNIFRKKAASGAVKKEENKETAFLDVEDIMNCENDLKFKFIPRTNKRIDMEEVLRLRLQRDEESKNIKSKTLKEIIDLTKD